MKYVVIQLALFMKQGDDFPRASMEAELTVSLNLVSGIVTKLQVVIDLTYQAPSQCFLSYLKSLIIICGTHVQNGNCLVTALRIDISNMFVLLAFENC